MRASWRRHRRAFTLIELLVVIVILGILMAVALPTFLRQQAKAQDSRTKQYLTTAFKAIRASTPDTNNQYPISTSMATWVNQSEPELTSVSGSCTTQVQTAPVDEILVDPASTSTALTMCARSQSGNIWTLTASATGGQQLVAAAASTALTLTALDSGFSTTGSHPCILLSDGSAKCWGEGSGGQLGNNAAVSSSSAVAVSGLSGATQISSGGTFTCALFAAGTVKCWGGNSLGQLGLGSTGSNQTAPGANVSGISNATQISAGNSFACARLSDSTIKCWGFNGQGQVGNGNTTTPQTSPQQVVGISNAVQVEAGVNTACARLADGSVECWGQNTLGQTGNGNVTSPQLAPVVATGVSNAAQLTAGYSYFCARLNDGSAMCWGTNSNGELGLGTTSSYQATAAPVSVASGFSSVQAGDGVTCAQLSAGGSVQCWGNGSYGQIGDGANHAAPAFGTVSGISSPLALTSGWNSCALISSSAVKCWGQGPNGENGDGSAANRNSPVSVLNLP